MALNVNQLEYLQKNDDKYETMHSELFPFYILIYLIKKEWRERERER